MEKSGRRRRKKLAVSKKAVEKKMRELGTYHVEFDEAITRYVALQKEYAIIYARYKAGGFECQLETASGAKKSPTVTTLESLRRDILAMEDALGLTPRGLQKLNEKAFAPQKAGRKNGLI